MRGFGKIEDDVARFREVRFELKGWRLENEEDDEVRGRFGHGG